MKHYSDLIRELALTDFKLRYNNSVLGYFWSLLNPLLYFGVLYLVFSVFLRFEVESYALYLLFGIIVWGYFAEATMNAMQSLIGKASLIKKIYFPRWIIVLSSNLTTSIGFCLNIVVFLAFFFISGAKPTWHFVFLIPYLLCLFLLILGVSLLISSLYTRFRDLAHIWGVLLQLGFWISVIIYPLSLIPERFHFWVLLNPMARLIFDARNAIVYGISPSPESIIGVVLFSVLIFAVGYMVFRKMSDRFAEWV